MWLAMTGAMMAPVVFPWVRALRRVAGGDGTQKLSSGSDLGRRVSPAGIRAPVGAATEAGMVSTWDARTDGAVRAKSSLRTAPFVAGYLVAWAGFSVAAAALQVALVRMSLPVPFRLDAPALSGAALILAGGYQLTPLKGACLSHCRSPAGFLLTNWRDGLAGRVRMGLEHGLHCVGCCWALMALALVVGMADLAWMALLMAIMVAETALPFGARLTKPVGVGLAGAGAVVAAMGWWG